MGTTVTTQTLQDVTQGNLDRLPTATDIHSKASEKGVPKVPFYLNGLYTSVAGSLIGTASWIAPMIKQHFDDASCFNPRSLSEYIDRDKLGLPVCDQGISTWWRELRGLPDNTPEIPFYQDVTLMSEYAFIAASALFAWSVLSSLNSARSIAKIRTQERRESINELLAISDKTISVEKALIDHWKTITDSTNIKRLDEIKQRERDLAEIYDSHLAFERGKGYLLRGPNDLIMNTGFILLGITFSAIAAIPYVEPLVNWNILTQISETTAEYANPNAILSGTAAYLTALSAVFTMSHAGDNEVSRDAIAHRDRIHALMEDHQNIVATDDGTLPQFEI